MSWWGDNEERVYRALPVVPGSCGLLTFGFGLYKASLWFVTLGLFVALISFTFPRLKGKVEIALGALKFKGDLTGDPDEPDEPD